MKKVHAFGAGLVGIALSATAAFAAAPHVTVPIVSGSDDQGSSGASVTADANTPTDNHGAVVSAVAQDSTIVGGKNNNHGGAVSAVARGTDGDAQVPTSGTDANTPTDNHGAVVSAVAQDSTIVGGKNNNHGGAVSAVARGTDGPNARSDGHPSGHP
jgi:hypothetical protein